MGHSKTRIRMGISRPADRDPRGAAGSGGVVVFESAGHAAPAEQGVRRVLPAGQAGREAGVSTVKGKARFDRVEWPKDGDGARWLPEHKRVYLQGVGQVKVTSTGKLRGG